MSSFKTSWREYRLGDICLPNNGIQTGPFGSQLHQKDYVSVGTPIITVEHLGDNRITRQNLPMVSAEDKERLSKYTLKKGDIVFSRVGSVDRRALVREEEEGWLFSGRCLRVRVNSDLVDPRFLSFLFGTETFKSYIRSIAVGATMPSLNTQLLSDVNVLIPPLKDQQAIAEVLSSLDDKIELNRQMNQTLEGMARALFKDWFVDFGPVKAKAAGQQPPGLAPEIADLFPDALDEAGVPVGWKTVSLSKIIEFNPTEKLPAGLEAPYLDMAALPTTGSWPDKPIKRVVGSGMKFRNGDTLFARITPCLENGKAAFIQCLQDDVIAWGSTEFIVLRPKHPWPKELAYLLARDSSFRSYAIQSMTGTSGRQRAQSIQLANFEITLPVKNDLAIVFGELVTEFFKQIKANSLEIETLTILRDTLLPKLMSGEVRVRDVEKVLA